MVKNLDLSYLSKGFGRIQDSFKGGAYTLILPFKISKNNQYWLNQDLKESVEKCIDIWILIMQNHFSLKFIVVLFNE